jgi:hypothetical protein
VGFVVDVMQDGKTRFLSYGETAKGSRAAPDPDTVYEIGSVIGVVVLSNTATMRITQFGELVTRAAFGLDVKPLPPRKPTPEHKEVAVDAATLARYVGVYPLFAGFDLTVSLENGRLMVQGTGQPKLPVFAESPTKFFCKAVDAQITFVPDKDGNVDRLTLHQNGVNLEAKRKK